MGPSGLSAVGRDGAGRAAAPASGCSGASSAQHIVASQAASWWLPVGCGRRSQVAGALSLRLCISDSQAQTMLSNMQMLLTMTGVQLKTYTHQVARRRSWAEARGAAAAALWAPALAAAAAAAWAAPLAARATAARLSQRGRSPATAPKRMVHWHQTCARAMPCGSDRQRAMCPQRSN